MKQCSLSERGYNWIGDGYMENTKKSTNQKYWDSPLRDQLSTVVFGEPVPPRNAFPQFFLALAYISVLTSAPD